EILFAQVDRREARPRVGPGNGARFIEKRRQDVKAARGHAVESAQPLDQHHGCLWHDPDRLCGNNQQDYADEEKKKYQQKRRQYGLALQQNHDRKWHSSPTIDWHLRRAGLSGARSLHSLWKFNAQTITKPASE